MNYVSAVAVFLVPLAFAAPHGDGVNKAPHPDTEYLRVFALADGSFQVNVRGQTWLSSAPTFFNADGQTYAQGASLKLVSQSTTNGGDAYGFYTLYTFKYQAGQSKITASIRAYEALPFVYFSQSYDTGANRTKASSSQQTISGFPSFLVQATKTKQGPLGYLAYGGIHTADKAKSFGLFSKTGLHITDGLDFGPMTLFDGSGDTLIISPASNFMAVSNWYQRQTSDGDTCTLSYGIMGGVDTVPAGFSVDFIVYYSSQGVNQAFAGWGEHLRTVYERTDTYVLDDLTINYLGYYTDNGAYYYYLSEPHKTYQDTIIDVKANADQIQIPYKYIQYDSWWYYKGYDNGVKTWEARPDIFPNGFQFVFNKTGIPAVGHNRFWSNDTVYATQNGGQYNFIVESSTGKAVPNDQRFWNDLMRNASAWGLLTYEQDWLNVEFDSVQALHTDVTMGDTWLTQMASAAVQNKMTVQYCMSESRHIMHALQTNVVTQTRASDDYHPGNQQWRIGVSSIFAYAMRIAPFKDNFWSTSDQPGNPYKLSEPNTETHLIASVLSTGPVGPSDRIGYSNVSLIMRCCNADGLILKPSKPATAVDDQIYQTALGGYYNNGVFGEVWTTYSEVGGLRFGIIFVPDITGEYFITPSKAGFNMTQNQLMVFEAHDTTRKLAAFSDQAPLGIIDCYTAHPCLYHVTPVLTQSPKVVLLGELAKVVPVSPQRVISIDVTGNDVKVSLKGVPNEVVAFTFSVDSNIVTISCTFSSRAAVIDLTDRSCK
ncbi:hypothetical protein V1264_020541 [Littorina saxatilis]|uniref:Uncharacterized protein n=2 Tax=Littorina saxatilis TaxID=31220 RepID=A0AAN9GCA7_9CAEN